jgi:hypothetical protein
MLSRRPCYYLLWEIDRSPIQLVEEAKRTGREADHPPPSSAEVKNEWSYTSTPPHISMASCLVKHQGRYLIHLRE